MPSRVEQIMLHLLDILTVPAMASIPVASVFRSLDAAISSGLPALVIEEGNESEPDLSVIDFANRRLSVQVRVVIKGDQPYSLADEPMAEAFGRIVNDRTLSGLAIDLTEGSTQRQRGMLEKPVGIITKNFLIQFETAQNSLS